LFERLAQEIPEGAHFWTAMDASKWARKTNRSLKNEIYYTSLSSGFIGMSNTSNAVFENSKAKAK